MTQSKRDRPAWPLFLLILLLGVCCMLGAGQFAIQLAPNWNLIADVDSNINPDDQLVLWSDSARLEPVSAAILTQPAWRATYLTPGASIFVPPIAQGVPTSSSDANTPVPAATQEPGSSATPGQPTIVSSSSTPAIILISTNTSIPPTKTKVSTSVPSSVPTVTPTRTGTSTVTATGTLTSTVTITSTSLALTVTPTDTATVTATYPDSTATATNTLIVVADTSTPTVTPTAFLYSYTPCKDTVELDPAKQDYDILTNQPICLHYQNSSYAYGGVFDIVNKTGGSLKLDWTGMNPPLPNGACGDYSKHLGDGDPIQIGVLKDSNSDMVIYVQSGIGFIHVEFSPLNTGCSMSFQPQPEWIAWSVGLIVVFALLGVLRISMSSVRM